MVFLPVANKLNLLFGRNPPLLLVAFDLSFTHMERKFDQTLHMQALDLTQIGFMQAHIGN